MHVSCEILKKKYVERRLVLYKFPFCAAAPGLLVKRLAKIKQVELGQRCSPESHYTKRDKMETSIFQTLKGS